MSVRTTKSPKLRFPGFNTPWEEKKLDDIASFSKGANISKSDIAEDGKTKAIRYGELYTTYGEVIDDIKSKTNLPASKLVLSKKDDVIMPASGESHIDIATASCVLKEGVALSGDINIIRSQNDGAFLAYYLSGAKKHEVARLSQGVSVVHLYAANLKRLAISLPTKEEQEKIADLFLAVEKRIVGLEKKKHLLEKYKKCVTQKVFTQRIRFKDENNTNFPKWQEKELGDIFEYEQPTRYIAELIDQGTSSNIPVLTAGKSFILGYTNETEGIYSDTPAIIFDDFTTSSHLVEFPFKVKSSAIKILKTKRIAKPVIAHQLLKSRAFVTDDHKRYWISTFQAFKVELPSIGEQKKIASFLVVLDDRIELQNKKLQTAKRFKESLLQQMFI